MTARKLEVYGNIDDHGKVHVQSDLLLKAWLKERSEKKIRLTFEEFSGKRTNPQNAYYWEIMVPMIKIAINDLGNNFSTEENHDFLKREFNYQEVETPSGAYLNVPQSTTKLDTIGFSDFKEKVQHFASEVLNVYIPDPDPSKKKVNY